MTKPRTALTDKEKRFVDEYMIHQSGAKAAALAGYSERNAGRIAWALMQRPLIAEAIEARQAKLAAKLGVTTERILEELAKIGFSDIRKAFTESGGIKRPEEWDEDFAGAMSSVKVITRQSGERDEDDRPILENVHEFKAWDKLAALEKLGKHLGMFKDKLELTGKDGGPVEVAQYDDKTKARALALILAKGLKPKSNA